MVSPAPVNPPDQTVHSPGCAGCDSLPRNRLLRAYGFHLLVVILGIALAFM